MNQPTTANAERPYRHALRELGCLAVGELGLVFGEGCSNDERKAARRLYAAYRRHEFATDGRRTWSHVEQIKAAAARVRECLDLVRTRYRHQAVATLNAAAAELDRHSEAPR